MRTKTRPRLADVQDAIVQGVSEGKTLAEAAALAGVEYHVLRRWLTRRDHAGLSLVGAIQDAASRASRIEGRARPLRRAREDGIDEFRLTTLYLNEILRVRLEGRVPLDCAIKALEMALDELNSIRLDQSVSWAESPEKARCFGTTEDTQ